MREVRIIETEDGSHSLFVPELNETYHSFHGALQESEHVFIRSGLDYLLQRDLDKNSQSSPDKAEVPNVKVLEIGFGTGLNALLTIRYLSQRPEMAIYYHTLEPYPLSLEVINSLNYVKLLHSQFLEAEFQRIHNAPWNTPNINSNGFTFYKEQTTLEDFAFHNQFNIIYFDAFAPNKQAELWTLEIMQKCYDLLEDEGILVTYCAQGQFKRNLKAAGFQVETIPGPPGKKEMVRAYKTS
jgi:tRNA U34 5-methylaminomethyl-2-thiouridine-forming methyltransferase MnmC